MIYHISIKNFAIIENAEVDFENGLNIITGETGAGKSIVIEAISLALGSRADSSCIRNGCEKATVQLQGFLDGKEITVVREVTTSGRNICKLNGEIVPLVKLNETTSKLADIHGQYDNQSLLNPDYHIDLLDSYRSDEIAPLKNRVSILYDDFTDCKSKLIALLNEEKQNTRQLDFYRYELNEIEKANPLPGEDIELEEKISVLRNSEKIHSAIESSFASLFSEGSGLDMLSNSKNQLETISTYSRRLSQISEEFNDIYYRLNDLESELRSIKNDFNYSSKDLDDVIARLNIIDNLKKKYGKEIDDIISYGNELKSKLNIIENFDDEKSKLERNLLSVRNELMEACEQLSGKRSEIAKELTKKISKELLDLNFPDSQIEIHLNKLEKPQANGIDNVEILISTNKGEPLKPLYKVASGGEMSRIMLAFKNVISTFDHIPTLIFDEIDNGISGITASIVASKLKEISENHQIICITHLPQIAASGKNNYRIFKESDDSATYTNINHLTYEEKVQEIARLLGGNTITETTILSAKELIQNS